MANKQVIRSCKRKQLSKLTTESVPVQTEQPELNKNSSKKKKSESNSASAKVKKIHNQKKSDGKRSDINVGYCHQCHRNDKDRVVECRKCQLRKFCVGCMTKWYPGVSEEEFVKACPVCCNNCNCKSCLRRFSPKDMQGYSCSEPDKIRYSKHILLNNFHLMRCLNEDQQTEKQIEAKRKGLSLSELQVQDAECEVDDDIFCDNCGLYFFDLYRSCACGYDLCLACSRELRDGQLKGGKGLTCGWKACVDGSIPCPPKDIGGCNDGILDLKRIMPVDWVENLLEKAQGVLCKINKFDDIPQTSMTCCMCCDSGNETTQRNAIDLYSLSAKNIQPQDMQHFQSHWLKGEPVIVNDVLSTSSGLSWEPMVMWRAFRDKTESSNHSHAHEANAVNCLDWSEVNIILYKFFRGYSEGQLKEKGHSLILKLEDWKPYCSSQGERPRHFVEFINCLPFKDYTNPHNGYLNVAVKLPDLSLKPDMGPRMDIAYGVEEELESGNSVTKLHFDKSDTVNVLTHTTSGFLTSSKLNKPKMGKQKHGALVCEAGLPRNEDQQCVVDPMEGSALWDIFRRQDVPQLEEYLRNHSADLKHANCRSVEQVVHPIHDRTIYLNMEHKRKLKEEYGIEPWTFKQKVGDAVFIPAGCPYQVRNLKSCTKIELNFVSPESIGECIRLQHELRMLPDNHRAKQHKLNIGKMMMYALDQAVADLAGIVDSNGHIDDLQFAKVPEIFNGDDINIGNHTNGWVCDSESDDNAKETSSVFPASSPLSPCTSIRSSSSLHVSPILKINHTVDHQPATIEVTGTSEGAIGLWHGNAVGPEAKELLQAIEHHYPDTFQGVQIRSKPYWLSILKELHVFIKSFLETSVDALAEERLRSLEDDLNDFERFGFDLSWARKRVDMVKNLKFRNDPLRQELMALEESLKSRHMELEEAKKSYKKAQNARNIKAREMAQKFGADYDSVLNGPLGFGMLPGY